MTQTNRISAEDVKRLRDRTGAGMMDCKRALVASDGDIEKATGWLREQGLSTAAKKADREVREGVIASYIHHGSRLGALIEVNCETDFVARTDEFQNLAAALAMQVAGQEQSRWVSRDDVPATVMDGVRRDLAEEAEGEGRPADRIPMIVDGKLEKWIETVCLLEQPYRDTDQKVGELITEKIALLGENIKVARFARMAVGDTADEEGRT